MEIPISKLFEVIGRMVVQNQIADEELAAARARIAELEKAKGPSGS